MLSKIRIKNYKSLKEVELELQRVNLLIGSNNSGKTNFLQALEFFGQCYEGKFNDKEEFERLSFRRGNNTIENDKTIWLNQKINGKFNDCYFIIRKFLEDTQLDYDIAFTRSTKNEILDYNNLVNEIKNNIFNFENLFCTIKDDKLNDSAFVYNQGRLTPTNGKRKIPKDIKLDKNYNPFIEFQGLKIYKLDINKLKIPYPVDSPEEFVYPDASNLVSYLDNMRDSKPEIIKNIEKDLNYCISEFKEIRFQKVQIKNDQRTHKKIGLINKAKETFWAEELSDGTLYFLALLAIIHQPEPPNLLLLEEPETNIHPRRLKDIMNYIFKHANEKDVQVIITTHSPLMLDYFNKKPQSVFIFEMLDGETKIKNLKTDIIDIVNEKAKNKGTEEIESYESLGDDWVTGLFGGVPNENY